MASDVMWKGLGGGLLERRPNEGGDDGERRADTARHGQTRHAQTRQTERGKSEFYSEKARSSSRVHENLPARCPDAVRESPTIGAWSAERGISLLCFDASRRRCYVCVDARDSIGL